MKHDPGEEGKKLRDTECDPSEWEKKLSDLECDPSDRGHDFSGVGRLPSDMKRVPNEVYSQLWKQEQKILH